MPRVQPKRSRFEPGELVKAWQAFSIDLHGIASNVRRGTQLRADHEVVGAAPRNFIRADAGDDELPSEYPSPAEPEAPRFTAPAKLQLKVAVLHGPAKYEAGQVAVFPPETAEWLVSEGHAKPL